MLSKPKAQLRGMFLDVSQAVQLELEETGLHPFEDTALLRFLICHHLDSRSALSATRTQICSDLVLCVGLFRQDPAFEWERRRKPVSRARQKQVQPEKRVIGNKPELTVPHILGILPHDSGPERVGADADGIAERIDGGTKLLPETGSPINIHFMPPQKRPRLVRQYHDGGPPTALSLRLGRRR
jgi:hypothetical protein